MTRDEAVLLARKLLQSGDGSYLRIVELQEAGQRLAAYVLAQDGAADPDPASVLVPGRPAVPSEHGLQNAVRAPGGEVASSSEPPGEPRFYSLTDEEEPQSSPSLANFACCNDCSSEHHHCPACGQYVRGNDVLYCCTRCENAQKTVQ